MSDPDQMHRIKHDGVYWGVVSSTRDPRNRGRIKVKVPDVLGNSFSEWAEPHGMETSDWKVGDKVWIEFPMSDIRYPVVRVPHSKKRATMKNGETALQMYHTSADAVFGGQDAAVVMTGGAVHCQSGPTGGPYVPCKASSFDVGSSEAFKDNIEPLDLDVVWAVQAAPSRTWNYKPEYGDPAQLHVGPMAEDLPGHVLNGDGTISVNNLIGVLWESVRTLSRKVEYLEAEKDYLKDRVDALEYPL